MFCNQCEQTAKGTACTAIGVCGKDAQVSDLQDLLIHAVQGLSLYAHAARQQGIVDPAINLFTCEAVFSTLTNVNFDPERLASLITQAVEYRQSLQARLQAAGKAQSFPDAAANFIPASDLPGMVEQGEGVTPASDTTENQDILSLKQILLYGLKGVAAYADHARLLGQEDDVVYAFIHEAMVAILRHDIRRRGVVLGELQQLDGHHRQAWQSRDLVTKYLLDLLGCGQQRCGGEGKMSHGLYRISKECK